MCIIAATVFELANRELARAKRFDHPVSLVMLDVDHFKAINDQHGHWRGAQVFAGGSAQPPAEFAPERHLSPLRGRRIVISNARNRPRSRPGTGRKGCAKSLPKVE